MKVSIQGIGVVGGFGCGIGDLEAALLDGGSPQSTVTMKTPEGDLNVPALTARTDRLCDFVDRGALRRLDHYIRMALLGSYLALEDAGLLNVEKRRMGVIVATGYGSTCNMMDIQQALTNDAPALSPTRFSNSVHNAAATHISILLAEMGPSLSVNDYDMSIPAAFLSACQWLWEGRVDSVLVGGVDEYCLALGYNWYRRYGFDLAGKKDFSPEHAAVGEGACFFVLTRQEGAAPYGFIEAVQMKNYRCNGFGPTPDAFHFLSVDAYSEFDDPYGIVLPHHTRAASYNHLYGVLPIGLGFDVAIAALSCKTGRIYQSAPAARHPSGYLNIIRQAEPLDGRSICCLKLGAGGTFGSVQVART